MILIYVFAGLGVVVALGLAGALLMHWQAARAVRQEQEGAIDEWLQENGYGDLAP